MLYCLVVRIAQANETINPFLWVKSFVRVPERWNWGPSPILRNTYLRSCEAKWNQMHKIAQTPTNIRTHPTKPQHILLLQSLANANSSSDDSKGLPKELMHLQLQKIHRMDPGTTEGTMVYPKTNGTNPNESGIEINNDKHIENYKELFCGQLLNWQLHSCAHSSQMQCSSCSSPSVIHARIMDQSGFTTEPERMRAVDH